MSERIDLAALRERSKPGRAPHRVTLKADTLAALVAVLDGCTERSRDSKFCAICLGDALKNGNSFDHWDDCPLARFSFADAPSGGKTGT